MESKVRFNLAAVIGKDTKKPSRSTGQLLSALGTSPAKQDRNGDFNVKVGFSEPRRNGDSNAKIASVLEYGRSGQRAKPFLKPAKSASKNAAIEAMKAKLSVVTLDNIFDHMQEYKEPPDVAAIRGTNEVIMPMIATQIGRASCRERV